MRFGQEMAFRLLGRGGRNRAQVGENRRRLGRSLLVLTGAGVSAESGIRTYRDQDGLWKRHDPRLMATLDGYRRNPDLVRTFHDELRTLAAAALPNAAHVALSQLGAAWPGPFTLVTTNGDELHERAGSRDVVHIHGSLFRTQCDTCRACWRDPEGSSQRSGCPGCGGRATLRPDAVFFGERPRHMDRVFSAVDECDIFLAVGCGGAVRPACLLPRMAFNNNQRDARIGKAASRTTEVNPAPTGDPAFTEVIKATACEALPQWCASVLRAEGIDVPAGHGSTPTRLVAP